MIYVFIFVYSFITVNVLAQSGTPPPCYHYEYKAPGIWVAKPDPGYDPAVGNCCDGAVFDPATAGCCINPQTGAEEGTSSPQNGDPCQAAKDAGYGVDGGGLVVCYNGQEVACVFETGVSDEIKNCIKVHEQSHIDEGVNGCKDCSVSGSKHKDGEAKKESECAAYQAELDCANAISDSDPNKKGLIIPIQDEMAKLGCP